MKEKSWSVVHIFLLLWQNGDDAGGENTEATTKSLKRKTGEEAEAESPEAKRSRQEEKKEKQRRRKAEQKRLKRQRLKSQEERWVGLLENLKVAFENIYRYIFFLWTVISMNYV